MKIKSYFRGNIDVKKLQLLKATSKQHLNCNLFVELIGNKSNLSQQ